METSFFQKISKYLLIVLFAISLVLIGMFYGQVVPLEDEIEQIEHSTTSLVLTWAEVLFFAAAALAIIVFVWNIILNPKQSISTGIMVAGLILVALIASALGSDSIDSINPTLVETTPGELKGSDTGLFSLYIMLGLSFLSIIWLEISSKLK